MSRALDLGVFRRDSVTARRLGGAIAVSLLAHALALWQWPAELRRPADAVGPGDAGGPLVVQLAPPPAPPRARAPRPPRPDPAPKAMPRAAKPPAPKPVPRKPSPPKPRPPVLALEKSETAPPAPPKPPATPPKPAAPSAADLLAYVESQRMSRELAPPAPPAAPARPAGPGEDENARANRLAASNLGLDRKPVFGERRRGGGIFEIERIGYDSAAFMFYGWHKGIRRNTMQQIEVRTGPHPDIRIAVVRRMIEIIREHESGDFIWESPRLGRNITLSARPRDNAGLEEFMMREFFDQGLPAARR